MRLSVRAITQNKTNINSIILQQQEKRRLVKLQQYGIECAFYHVDAMIRMFRLSAYGSVCGKWFYTIFFHVFFSFFCLLVCFVIFMKFDESFVHNLVNLTVNYTMTVYDMNSHTNNPSERQQVFTQSTGSNAISNRFQRPNHPMNCIKTTTSTWLHFVANFISQRIENHRDCVLLSKFTETHDQIQSIHILLLWIKFDFVFFSNTQISSFEYFQQCRHRANAYLYGCLEQLYTERRYAIQIAWSEYTGREENTTTHAPTNHSLLYAFIRTLWVANTLLPQIQILLDCFSMLPCVHVVVAVFSFPAEFCVAFNFIAAVWWSSKLF